MRIENLKQMPISWFQADARAFVATHLSATISFSSR
jgi:hypothetical protein